jgi:Dolichyl-phosphate-mannose-protein mannosyltransferase
VLERAQIIRTKIPLFDRQWWLSTHERVPPYVFALALALAAVLLCTNVATYPRPWIDEGYFSATAAALAFDGVYSPRIDSSVPQFHPSISTGPTVIVPVALVFKLFGVGLLPMRIVCAAIGMLVLVGIGLLSRRMSGARVAFVMVVLVLAGTPDSYMSFVPMARQMIGEVTAIGLCLYGVWLMMRTRDLSGGTWWRFMIVGCTLGLAIVTKPQLVVAIPGAVALTAILDTFYYNTLKPRSWASLVTGLGFTVVGWYAFQAALIGGNALTTYYLAEQDSLRVEVMTVNLRHMRRAVGSLWRGGFFFLGLPGVLYGLWLARQRTFESLCTALLLCIWGLWTLWMIGLSIGWSRYAFYSVLIPLFWSSHLLVALLQRWTGWRRIALAALVSAGLLYSASHMVLNIFGEQDRSAELFASALDERVPEGSVIVSWEWELEMLTQQRFRYPPPTTWYAVVDYIQTDTMIPEDLIDLEQMRPDYVIEGPFSMWTGVFSEYLSIHAVRELEVGSYVLYKVMR